MVCTHLPSSLFLAALPLAPNLGTTIPLLIGRSMLSSMDQAPRSAFLSAIVLPGERTAVMGVVNIAKTMSQSAGPTVTGWLAGEGRFWVAFVVAGGLKGAYDVLLLGMFGGRVHVRKSEDVHGDEDEEDNNNGATEGSEAGAERADRAPQSVR